MTQMNTFNLFHVYDNNAIPVHDPEDQSSDLGNSALHMVNVVQGFNLENPFHPYLNENSWHLGDWYWNQGMQKSKKSFTNLLDIIRSTDFQPEDVSHTNWAAIDHKLDSQKAPEWQDLAEWMDDGRELSRPGQLWNYLQNIWRLVSDGTWLQQLGEERCALVKTLS